MKPGCSRWLRTTVGLGIVLGLFGCRQSGCGGGGTGELPDQRGATMGSESYLVSQSVIGSGVNEAASTYYKGQTVLGGMLQGNAQSKWYDLESFSGPKSESP